MKLEPEQMISRYRLVEKIGEGGMGVVWKAFDTDLKRHVAIKILTVTVPAGSDRRIRFKREAQTAAALDHPNIAVIHEVSEYEGHPFIVMQNLEGKTLGDRIAERPMSVREWLRFAVSMCSGMAYAHKRGIIHRDLKPRNVMVAAEGQVKIVDFGLAKLFDRSAFLGDSDGGGRRETLEKSLTNAGEVFGTFNYMSPEQARGEPVDHRSDIFSLGIILYEMASQRKPFGTKNPAQTITAIVSEDPVPLYEVAPGFPSAAHKIVNKALRKDSAKRYQSAEEMETDLRDLEKELDRLSTMPEMPAPSAVPTAGGRGWLYTTIVIVAALLAAAAYFILSGR